MWGEASAGGGIGEPGGECVGSEVEHDVAKAICADCPACQECLEYAVAIREPHGIWGGLNETERRVLIEAAG